MAMQTKPLTLRQQITMRNYRPGVTTQAELAKEVGGSISAISTRLKRARVRMGLPARQPKVMKRLRVPLTSLEAATGG